jgi:hypothetical protein
MKFNILKLILLVLVVLLFAQNEHAIAQCAMCKSNLEMARTNGGTNVGNTLNNGILYLLALPYLIACVFGFLYYRNYRLKKSNHNQSL